MHPLKVQGSILNYDESKLLIHCTTEELFNEYNNCQKILSREKWRVFFKSIPLLDVMIFLIALWFFLQGERNYSSIGIGVSLGIGVSVFCKRIDNSQLEIQKIERILHEIKNILRNRSIVL